MIKPERIEQWAWDAAKEVTDYHDGLPTIIEAIANAILQSRARAYEEAWNEAIDAAALTAKNDAFPSWRESILSLKRQAIRQHSQKGKDND